MMNNMKFVYPLSLEFERFILNRSNKDIKDTFHRVLSDEKSEIDLQLSPLSKCSGFYRLNVKVTDGSGTIFQSTNVIRLSENGIINYKEDKPVNLRTLYVKTEQTNQNVHNYNYEEQSSDELYEFYLSAPTQSQTLKSSHANTET
ncbi:unnamed protein product [Rotaria magnacalcarata]|uniref:Uncharacterized protein n=1 Tax=Rotaria magnacalcarata TaxID=392030 RepID=A0A815Q5L3_9BILA|nr:unnamed protein product [Rotaria magnacalcarata]